MGPAKYLFVNSPAPELLLLTLTPTLTLADRVRTNQRTRTAGDILIRGRHVNSVIISPRMDFSWERHFNVTPAMQRCGQLQTDDRITSVRQIAATCFIDAYFTLR